MLLVGGAFQIQTNFENAMSQVSKRKKSSKKMRRRKLKKNATQKMQCWKLPFFSHFPLHSFWCCCIFLLFFSFFFRKKMQPLIKVAKNATEKMQRRKLQKKCNGENATLEVAFFLLFPFRYFWHLHFPLHF